MKAMKSKTVSAITSPVALIASIVLFLASCAAPPTPTSSSAAVARATAQAIELAPECQRSDTQVPPADVNKEFYWRFFIAINQPVVTTTALTNEQKRSITGCFQVVDHAYSDTLATLAVPCTAPLDLPVHKFEGTLSDDILLSPPPRPAPPPATYPLLPPVSLTPTSNNVERVIPAGQVIRIDSSPLGMQLPELDQVIMQRSVLSTTLSADELSKLPDTVVFSGADLKTGSNTVIETQTNRPITLPPELRDAIQDLKAVTAPPDAASQLLNHIKNNAANSDQIERAVRGYASQIFNAGQYITCDFNLFDLLTQASGVQDISKTKQFKPEDFVTGAFGDAVSYFTLTALVKNVKDSKPLQTYHGTLIRLVPQCSDDEKKAAATAAADMVVANARLTTSAAIPNACTETGLRVGVGNNNSQTEINLEALFNDRLYTTTSLPSATDDFQWVWTSVRPERIDNGNTTTVRSKIEVSRSQRSGQQEAIRGGLTRHDVNVFRQYGSRMRMWPRKMKIYIGGGPTLTNTKSDFHTSLTGAGLVYILIEPGGGSGRN